MSPFVFLDRDGTLVRDRGYVHRVQDYELLPGVPQALRELAKAGFRLVIVTNQSGIGRGYFTTEDFERFQAHLVGDLGRHGLQVVRTYHCPHRPDQGCGCRKPATGLLERAQRELGADLAASWVIGDSEGDVELARRAGCCGAVLLGSSPEGAVTESVLQAPDLEAAAAIVIRRAAKPEPS